MVPILQRGKLKHEEVKGLAQGHTVAELGTEPKALDSTTTMMRAGGEKWIIMEYQNARKGH